LDRYAEEIVNIIIPVYEATSNLFRTVWSVKHSADMPYHLIIAEEKQCVAKNRNAGLERAEGNLIVFIDDDVLLPGGWLSLLAAALEQHEKIGVVSAQMTGLGGQAQNGLHDIPRNQLAQCTPPGTCFMYDRKKLEGCTFDEEYTGSQWEDTDFMKQVQAMGLICVASGSVWILHDNQFTEANKEVWLQNEKRFNEKWPGGGGP
jgi:glycosyltransferase involved in cell wall biosynthesis